MSPAKLTQKHSRNRGPIAWKDGTACLVCGSHADVKPIYGDKRLSCSEALGSCPDGGAEADSDRRKDRAGIRII
jgi:hypothetical protein